MKLCPKCEFIYEDDQRFCDMDGEALVADTRVGVFPATGPTKIARKSRMRVFVAPAVAGLALSLLLSLVYYASSAPLDSKLESTDGKTTASETSLQQQTAPPVDPSSQSTIDPSQPPANPEAASEPVSTSAVELADRATSESARKQVVPTSKANDSLNGGDNGLGISSELPPLPQLTPLPRVPPLKRLPTAKPETRTPGSTPTKKQRLSNQKVGTNRKPSNGDVKPDRGDENKRSKVGAFLKKTGRILKKPFQL